MSSPDTLRELTAFLDQNECPYSLLEHEPYHSSEEASRITSVKPEHAAKSLLYASAGEYALAVLPASERVSTSKLRRALHTKDVRLALPDDIEQLMGCKIGTCHPVGRLAGIRTIVDPSLGQSEVIGFSTGDPEHTITMRYVDYERVAIPEVIEIRSVFAM